MVQSLRLCLTQFEVYSNINHILLRCQNDATLAGFYPAEGVGWSNLALSLNSQAFTRGRKYYTTTITKLHINNEYWHC